MKKIDFNQNWSVKPLGSPAPGAPVTLPHDAMLGEKRSLNSRGRHNIGWFEAGDYEYTKVFTLPEGYTTFQLELEGVYHDAKVFVNGLQAAYRPYGYTGFLVDITPYVRWEEENQIRVIAHNSDQPNSRWYSGTGIYRPVWLYCGKEQYIWADGIRVRTLSLGEPAKIGIRVETAQEAMVEVRIQDPQGKTVVTEMIPSGPEQSLSIPSPWLWSPETPNLYTCIARVEEDEVRQTFGIRTLSWNKEQGIAINGERVILKGACIHHDNGLLGACAFPEAEERKIRLLKQVGYNSIRSAHNPCSKAMLEACDRLGILVMDEYTDMWYIHKNAYDYATHMGAWWRQDLEDMVRKDYNHPCVILYSTGNEVAETGQPEGIALTGEMTRYLHELDDTRPVSCGINIFFNFLYSWGFGVYSDEKAKKEADSKSKPVGSEFYNTLAGILGDKIMKLGATLPMCDWKTRDAYAAMDIAGYNYGICRYDHDLKAYPDRLILGSETFCKDAYRFMEQAKKNPRLVGDFVWAGMDYMGEAGIGSWEYEDHAPQHSEDPGWLTAGSGRLNILGFPLGEAAYTSVALEKEMGPRMAVRPVYQTGRHTPSAWKMTDAMESWSWPGCQGMEARVEVYARADRVELRLNGKIVGQKKLKNTCNVTFRIPYAPGLLEAVAYDAAGKETGSCALRSAGADTKLSILPEEKWVEAGKLCFVRLRYTDAEGIWKPMEKHRITIRVDNGTLAGFGNACPYNPDGYRGNAINTHYGEAMAVVRAGETGQVTLTLTDETGEYTLDIPIKEGSKC